MTGPDASDAFGWLQNWYAAQCDGEWEDEFGITIETVDGAGWRVEIDVERTAVEGRDYESTRRQRSDSEWVNSWLDGGTWQASCGPQSVAEALALFRAWVEGA